MAMLPPAIFTIPLSSWMRLVRRAIMFVVAVTFAVPCDAAASSLPPDESQVKAAMILNIARFVDWPAAAFPSEVSPLAVCMVGRMEFGQALTALAGKTVKGRVVVVRPISRNDIPDGCNILVVGESEQHRIPATLERVGQRSVVTISDVAGFARAGGTIGLVNQEGRIHIELNLEAAHLSGIRVSSQLSKLATIVRTSER